MLYKSQKQKMPMFICIICQNILAIFVLCTVNFPVPRSGLVPGPSHAQSLQQARQSEPPPVTVDSSLILRILRTELPRGGFSQKYFLFWLQWGNSQTSGKCINLFKVWQIFWVTTTTTTVYCPKSFVKYLKEKHFCCRNESEKSELNINFISDNIYQRTSRPHLKQIF